MSDRTRVPSGAYDENYFLNLSGGSELYALTQGAEIDPRARRVLDFVRSNSDTRVLDIGCGRGELLKAVSRLDIKLVVGLDFAPASVHIAARTVEQEVRTGHCSLSNADATALPYANRIFDYVTMTDVVEHLHPWQLARCLKECYRVLKNSGQVLIHTFPNKWCWNYGYPILRFVTNQWRTNPTEKLPANPRTDYDPILHVNEQTQRSLDNSLRRAGFAHVGVWLEFSSITPYVHFLSRGGSLKREALFKLISLPMLRNFFFNDIYAIAQK